MYRDLFLFFTLSSDICIMARLSNAEKQKLYRQRLNLALYSVLSTCKKREKYIKDKESGRRKLISELSDREKMRQRKTWRKGKKREAGPGTSLSV